MKPSVLPASTIVSESVRAAIVDGLEHSARAATLTDVDNAIADMFEKCLPLLLRRYVEAGLLIDYRDLESTVRRGLPVVLCNMLDGLLSESEVGGRLYAPHLCTYVRRSVQVLASQLDRTFPPISPRLTNDERLNMARLQIWMNDLIRNFAATVLIGGPVLPEPTREERRVARKARLQIYFEIHRRQGVERNFSTVCTIAEVPRKGRGSGARWLDGTLTDQSRTAQRIERVISFDPGIDPAKKLEFPHCIPPS